MFLVRPPVPNFFHHFNLSTKEKKSNGVNVKKEEKHCLLLKFVQNGQ